MFKIIPFEFVARGTALVRRHERRASAIALFSGFLWDSLTLGRPDRLFENVVLIGYLALSAGCIALLNLKSTPRIPTPILLLVLQFSFGNLAGGLAVLYGKSGTFEGSTLFFLLFALFLIGNEFLRSKYDRIQFHLSAWYFLCLAYTTLIVPVILGTINDTVFLVSGTVSVSAISILYVLLRIMSAKNTVGSIRQVAVPIAAIFLFFNGLYALNVLPPVPLSLKTIGVYHSVSKVSDGYKGEYEAPRWYEFFRDTSAQYGKIGAEGASCFSSVFAPTGLTAPVYHRWEYYDENAGQWSTQLRVRFEIVGGREEGFRGYTRKESLWAGRWRCGVETERGALIGRMTFEVVSGGSGMFLERIL